MLYFDAWGIGTLVCVVFALLLLLYLLNLRNKSGYSRVLTIFFFAAFLMNVGFFMGAVLPFPLGAYHRFLTVHGSLFSIVLMIQFAYAYPRNLHVRESRIVLGITLFLSVTLSAAFIIEALRQGPAFDFKGQVFNFLGLGKRTALGLLLQIAWFISVMIRKARSLEGAERRAIILIMIALLIPSLGPAIGNALFQREIVSHGVFQQFFVVLSVLGYFTITIIFINNTVDRTSFMTKIVGISVVTLLMVVQIFSTVVTLNKDAYFDRIRRGEAVQSLLINGTPPDSAAYVLSYSPGEDQVRIVADPVGGLEDYDFRSDFRERLATAQAAPAGAVRDLPRVNRALGVAGHAQSRHGEG